MPDADAQLVAARERFVATWGQMAGAWGISRTMAEIHALLFISAEPMNTDEIMEQLQISRGNASMSVRALADWGIISKTHKKGDRKEYYAADQDVWSMFRAIVRERLKREVEPLVAQLYEIRDLTPSTKAINETAEHNKRLEDLLDFFETVDKLGNRFVSPSGKGLQTAATLLSKIP